MKNLPLAIERLQSKGPTLDQIEPFLKILPLHIQAMVQFTVSEDHEIALTIFRSGQRFEALFDIDRNAGFT